MACGENDNAKTDKTFTKLSQKIVIEPKLYLEHSRSIFAYDVANAKNGQFKNTLVQLIQGFNKVTSKRHQSVSLMTAFIVIQKNLMI